MNDDEIGYSFDFCIIARFYPKNSVDCIALACTDLQLLLPSTDKIVVFDTMKILAEATVNMILSK